MKKRIEVNLTPDDIKFIRWMAKRDQVSFHQELSMYFWTEFEQCKELYKAEMEMEQK